MDTASPTPDSFTTFGALLRYLRVRARLAQRDLAIALGYTDSHISRLEQGHRRPDVDVVRAHFITALKLDERSAWAVKLVALATAMPNDTAKLVDAALGSASLPTEPATALLATKLYYPRPRARAVVRPRLLRLLDGALAVPLTLVAAPAGFGKSTLVASWLQEARAAWLTLDGGDNELGRFLRYLVAALRNVAPELSSNTLALLMAPEAPPLRALLTPLVNELFAVAGPIVLALDDYHLITNPIVHAALDFLLERPPPALHLVLITRSYPPLALNRLRGRGELLELHGADLRFTAPEAAAFLQKTMGLQVSAADLALLEARTEGWAAGLQLAALALREQPDHAAFVAGVAGSNHYVLEYLAEEVLDRLPDHLRTFLLQTSILDRLCGDLCDAVCGLAPSPSVGAAGAARPARTSYSQRLIEELERLNLFVVPLDNERIWYRYHSLFAELLRERLRRGTRREQLADLHRRASLWFWRHQLGGEAVKYALQAPDYDLAAEQIEATSGALLHRGESASLLRWVRALPGPYLRRRPALALAAAWALFHTNEWRPITAILDGAEAALQGEAHPLAIEALALRGCIAAYSGNAQRAINWCERALDLLPDNELRVRSALLIALGTAHYSEGNVRKAYAIALQAIDVSSRGCYLFPTLHAHYYAMAGLLTLGELDALATHAEQARRFAAAMGSAPSPALGMVLVMQGRAAYERGRLDEARAAFAEGLALCRELGYPEALADAHLGWARLSRALGDEAGVDEHLRQGRQILAQNELHPFFVSEWRCTEVALLLGCGAIDAAEDAARAHGLDQPIAVSINRYFAIVAQARLALARRQPAMAADLLHDLLALEQVDDLPGMQLDILVPLALALHAAGQRERALVALERALAIAATTGSWRVFLDEGPQMCALLALARPQSCAPELCNALLAGFTSAR